MTDTLDIRRGLTGVVVDSTAVSKVVPETNSLTYRGYAVQDLAANRSFEEVAYLLWHGELPTPQELDELQQRERASRVVDVTVKAIIGQVPTTSHPMDVVRTAISYYGAAAAPADNGPESDIDAGLRMMAVLPTIVAADMRRRRGQEAIEPNPDLGFTENFLSMCFGKVPDAALVKAFEKSLILYAEHGFNASTFAARVVTSTLSDVYSAVTAAIGALKGPLHGGANEAVMHFMLEIDNPNEAAAWLTAKLAAKEKIMGFGHRVYKSGDSRVPTMRAALADIAAVTDGGKWIQMYDVLEKAMADATGIKPNLDFPTGPAYHLMGLDTHSFTPIFVMSRITGWTAHIAEQNAANALIRPLSAYIGLPQRPLPPAVAKSVNRLTHL